jgi:hypothetical protein
MRVNIALVFLPVLLLGCFATNRAESNRESLGETASAYYNLLMWKYYDRASLFVDEDKRDEFERFILESRDKLNITNYELRDVVFNSDEKKGLVRVLISYYKYPSVSEKNVLLEDTWILKERKWYNYSDFEEEIFK